MRLTVLGGSAAGPNSGWGCSGYLVRHFGTSLVLDLGPGTLPELRRHANFRELTGIVISHLHLDHILDLFALRFALSYNPVRPAHRTPLHLPPGGVAFFEQAAALFAPESPDDYFASVFDISEYDPAEGLRVGDLHLTFAETVHYIPCWAIRLSAGTGRDLVYTADAGPRSDLDRFADGATAMVVEAAATEANGEDVDRRGHLSPSEAASLATKAGAEFLVISHLWQENGIAKALRTAEQRFDGVVLGAHPGMTLEW